MPKGVMTRPWVIKKQASFHCLSLSVSLSLSLSHTHTHTQTHTHTHTHTPQNHHTLHSPSCTLTFTIMHTHTHTLSFSQAHMHFTLRQICIRLIVCLFLTHTYTRTHICPLSPPRFHSLSLSLC